MMTNTAKAVDFRSVAQKIYVEYYSPKTKFPTEPQKPNTVVDVAIFSEAAIALIRAAAKSFDESSKKYLEDREAYWAECARVEAEFRSDLERENEMVGHPKADVLFAKAWERGHSSGFGEVLAAYEDLIVLVK
jgi:hypothetical protein